MTQNQKFEVFEDAIKEYGMACENAKSAHEWGVGVFSAEKYKKECYDEVIRIAKEIAEEGTCGGECPN